MEWISVFILFYINLITSMDRFTLGGVKAELGYVFNVEKTQLDLLQGAFIISYSAFALIFGYLGDRYSRRLIMSLALLVWSVTTFVSSFIDTSYYWFVAFRFFAGIGEASYSVIAPSLIGDFFVAAVRTKVLAGLYFAPLFAGVLGYLAGAQAARLGGAWYWSLRVTPVLGFLAAALIWFFMRDPIRGAQEGGSAERSTSWYQDWNYLRQNKTFQMSTLGFTCVTFVTGALAWWGPSLIHYGILGGGSSGANISSVSSTFEITTMVAGMIGVPLGVVIATKLRPKRGARADPEICAAGVGVSIPLIIGGTLLAQTNEAACYIVVFLGQIFLYLNWAIVTDMLLNVVIPSRRATAAAFQLLAAHCFFGDGYLLYAARQSVAMVRKAILRHFVDDDLRVELTSLQVPVFVVIIGFQLLGIFYFLFTSRYIVRDKMVMEMESGNTRATVGQHSDQSIYTNSQAESGFRVTPKTGAVESGV